MLFYRRRVLHDSAKTRKPIKHFYLQFLNSVTNKVQVCVDVFDLEGTDANKKMPPQYGTYPSMVESHSFDR
jgi:hypothetical protein